MRKTRIALSLAFVLMLLLVPACVDRTQVRTIVIPEEPAIDRSTSSQEGIDYGKIEKIYQIPMDELLNSKSAEVPEDRILNLLGWDGENSIQFLSQSQENDSAAIYEVDYRYNFYSKLVDLKNLENVDTVSTAPGGEYAAYIAAEKEAAILHLINTRSGLDRELLTEVNPDLQLIWSANGRYLALCYQVIPQKVADIRMLLIYDTDRHLFHGYLMEDLYSDWMPPGAQASGDGEYAAISRGDGMMGFVHLSEFFDAQFDQLPLTPEKIQTEYIRQMINSLSGTVEEDIDSLLKGTVVPEYDQKKDSDIKETGVENMQILPGGDLAEQVRMLEQKLQVRLMIGNEVYEDAMMAAPIAWLEDGRALIIYGGTLALWSTENHSLTILDENKEQRAINRCIFSEEGDAVFYSAEDGNLYVLPLDGGEDMNPHPVAVYSGFDIDAPAFWNRDARKLVICGYDRTGRNAARKVLVIEFGVNGDEKGSSVVSE